MVLLSVLLLLFSEHMAWADYRDDGVEMEFSFGIPSLTITNPDGSKATYEGLGIGSKGLFPLTAAKYFRADATASIRFLDFKNKANDGTQSEDGQYLGPGLGLQISLSRFFAGGDYYFLRGRHTAVGVFSHKSEFDVQGLNYYAGFRMDMGAAAVGLSWSHMDAKIPGGEVGVSGDSKWNNDTYWLNFTYKFKTVPGKFFKGLFYD